MKELLSQMEELLAALSAQVTEMEEDLDTARKDLLKSEEVNVKLERDLREVSDSGRVCCPEVRLLCPWDSPGKNTGVGCHFLL